jgi:pimeloyl-ACP methyl ester carboxylesterase
MCPGFGHEYMRSHRAFVRMAEQLAMRGIPVFRYDHEGTGDSAGEMDGLDVARLEDGVSVAAEEVLAMSEAPRVAIIGHRLGAWLALKTASRLPCRAAVLCDPVLDGSAYVRLLHSEGTARASAGGDLWVHGYPWSAALLQGLDREVLPEAVKNGAGAVLSFGGETLPEWQSIESRINAADLLRPGPLVVPSGGAREIVEFLENAA